MNEDAARLLCGTPELPPRTVSLTFDDGPGPRTAELARLLRDQGVPGTFFVLGESIDKHRDALAAIRDCGHAIGLHADRHRPFRSAEHAADELARCAARIPEYLTGTTWFRPPYGTADWRVPGFAGPVGWHAQGQDWHITYRHGQTVAGCVDAIVSQITEAGGGIVLLHDFAAATEFEPAGLTEADLDLRITEVTALLIQRLRAAGFSFTALPEPAATTERAVTPEPAVAPRPAAAGLPMADDMQSVRFNRTAAKAAGGILDLLMPIRTGDGPPLFCMHPVVGLSWCYVALLPYIDARFPIYGLQARSLGDPNRCRPPWRRWRGTTPTRYDWRSHQAPTTCSAGHWAGMSPSRSRRNLSGAVSRSVCSSSWMPGSTTWRGLRRATSPGWSITW